MDASAKKKTLQPKPSGFVRTRSKDGETLSEVCSREGQEFSRGCAFYLLQRKESISADKELVLWDGSSFVSSGVRSRLGLKNGKINISPNQIPEGMQLFVQSTSANRKLDGGEVLIRSSGEVAKRKRSASEMKEIFSKRAPKAEESEEEEEEEEEEEPKKKKKKLKDDASVKKKSQKTKKAKKTSDDEEDEGKEEDDDEGDEDDKEDEDDDDDEEVEELNREEAEDEGIMKKVNKYAKLAKKTFTKQCSDLIEWKNPKTGRSLFLRAASDMDASTEEDLGWKWPRALLGSDLQAVLAGVWCRLEDFDSQKKEEISSVIRRAIPVKDIEPLITKRLMKLIGVWTLGMDETSFFHLPGPFVGDVNDLLEASEKREFEQLVGRENTDCFSISSGDEEVEELNCPALEMI